MLEFYNKYSNFNSLYRKYPITKKTPSWVFIESSNKEKIIPNPLGLLRRSGEEKKLVISNQKRGDNYMKVLYGNDYMKIPAPEEREAHSVVALEFADEA